MIDKVHWWVIYRSTAVVVAVISFVYKTLCNELYLELS